MPRMARNAPLRGTCIAITRPVGTGTTLARQVRARGGVPLSLPGSSLREAPDRAAARAQLVAALACDVAIFTSPAAVHFAAKLGRLRGPQCILGPGAGTLRALRRAGVVHGEAPQREDSEGLLALPALQAVRGRRVAIIGAAGGRGLLQRELARRGAHVVQAHVYLRLPARLDQRHATALRGAATRPLYVLLSSAAALAAILAALPAPARTALLGGTAVASSARLAVAARDAGFARVLRATSAHGGAMLEAVADDRAGADRTPGKRAGRPR